MNDFFEIPPVPVEINTKGGDMVTIQPPSSWIGFAPVNVHLLSYHLRDGQVGRIKYRVYATVRNPHINLAISQGPGLSTYLGPPI